MIETVLDDYKNGRLSLSQASQALTFPSYVETGVAKLDLLRRSRIGIPECVYCQDKSVAQIKNILSRYLKEKQNGLLTKLSLRKATLLKKEFPLHYGRRGKIGWYLPTGIRLRKTGILILTAGSSDRSVAIESMITAMFLGHRPKLIEDCGVAGLQRIFSQSTALLKSRVIIVVAGMEGALSSVVSGLTGKPVIGVPTSVGYGLAAGGKTALNAMLSSCSPTVSVMNVDNGFGAACFAHAILTQVDPAI